MITVRSLGTSLISPGAGGSVAAAVGSGGVVGSATPGVGVAAGAHEALLLDANGRVIEGTTSNVFLVSGSEIVTPPEAAGILAGITRGLVISIAPSVGLTLREASFTADELAAADEAFLSSSLREILPIVRVDGRTVGSGAPGPATRALHAAFRARAGAKG